MEYRCNVPRLHNPDFTRVPPRPSTQQQQPRNAVPLCLFFGTFKPPSAPTYGVKQWMRALVRSGSSPIQHPPIMPLGIIDGISLTLVTLRLKSIMQQTQ